MLTTKSATRPVALLKQDFPGLRIELQDVLNEYRAHLRRNLGLRSKVSALHEDSEAIERHDVNRPPASPQDLSEGHINLTASLESPL